MAYLISPALAFGGGLVNFLGSCFLPLLPLYFGYLGLTANESKRVPWRKLTLFSLGFLVAFFLLGIAAQATIGLIANRRLIEIIIGIFLLLLVVQSYYPARISLFNKMKGSDGVGLVLGLLLAIIWTPCIGPVFATVLYLASNTSTKVEGGILLVSYGLGLVLPFLLLGYTWQSLRPVVNRYQRLVTIMRALSLILIIVFATLLITGFYGQLVAQVISHFSTHT